MGDTADMALKISFFKIVIKEEIMNLGGSVGRHGRNWRKNRGINDINTVLI